MFFLRSVPRDPFAPGRSNWGLRSYASPPQAPAAGADVFDVYTESTAIGLNGLPYRDW